MALFDERQPMCIPARGCCLGLSNTGKTMPQTQPTNLPNCPPSEQPRQSLLRPSDAVRGVQICYAPRRGRPATGATSYMSPLALALALAAAAARVGGGPFKEGR